MKKLDMIKIIRQEIRREFAHTGLWGKRGPAKNVPVMIARAVDAVKPSNLHSDCKICMSIGLSE